MLFSFLFVELGVRNSLQTTISWLLKEQMSMRSWEGVKRFCFSRQCRQRSKGYEYQKLSGFTMASRQCALSVHSWIDAGCVRGFVGCNVSLHMLHRFFFWGILHNFETNMKFSLIPATTLILFYLFTCTCVAEEEHYITKLFQFPL